MDFAFDFTFNLIKSFLLPIVFTLIGASFGIWQGRRSLKKREFRHLLNFSLNIVENGQLKIRTLIEKPCSEIFRHATLTKVVNAAAARTTKENCLLPIKARDDYWVCLNTALNEVSQRFSEGYLKADIDPVARRAETYLMCLTFEVAGADKMKTKKIRAMLIKKSVLERFPANSLQVERPTHQTRVITLRQLAASYRNEDWKHCFIEVELCV